MPYALYGPVIEIHVRNFKQVRQRFRQDGEIVVLARDLDFARGKILHRVVAAVVSEFETARLRAAGEGEQLVPQANAHDGDDSVFDRIYRINRIWVLRGCPR